MWSTDRVRERAKPSQLACLPAKQSVLAPFLAPLIRDSCTLLLGEVLHGQWWELGCCRPQDILRSICASHVMLNKVLEGHLKRTLQSLIMPVGFH